MKFNFPQDKAKQINVAENLSVLAKYCFNENLQAIVIGAADSFLSEYNPLQNNLRYAVSHFSGSTGDGVFISKETSRLTRIPFGFHLAVDGRYHAQADLECKQFFNNVCPVHLAKIDLQTGIEGWLKEILAKVADISATSNTQAVIGTDFSRTTFSRLQWLGELNNGNVKILNLPTLTKLLKVEGWKVNRQVNQLPSWFTGRTTSEICAFVRAKISKTYAQNFAYLTCATDDASFILNSRGYHLPYQSSFLAYTVLTHNKLFVHFPIESENCETPQEWLQNSEIVVSKGDTKNLFSEIKKANSQIDILCFQSSNMNAVLPQEMLNLYPTAKFVTNVDFISEMRARKTPEELSSIRKSFERSSVAIANTLRVAKQKNSAEKFSEKNLANLLSENYEKQGAVGLSFRTISGCAANGAIVHYGAQSESVFIESGDLVLLDSGAYYEEGFATDCTRGYFKNGDGKTPEPWQKEIYTVCLKAFIAGMTSEFPEGTLGKEIDTRVRNVCKQYGYNYAHGTGHGVGILVHESGARISLVSEIPLVENAVVSMEPGIYLEGKGGVRIENVVAVKKLANGKLGFENLVWTGFDDDLIDSNLLNETETEWITWYTSECTHRGTLIC